MHIPKDLAGVALFALLAALNQWVLIPRWVIDEGSSPIYPYLLNGLLAALLLCYAAEMIRLWRKDRRKLSFWRIAPRELGRIVLLLAAIWIWGMALAHYGFLLTTAVFLGFTAWLYGERVWRKILLLALITPLALYVAFTLMGSALPQGPLESALGALMH